MGLGFSVGLNTSCYLLALYPLTPTESLERP